MMGLLSFSGFSSKNTKQVGSIMALVLTLPNCSEFHLFLCFVLFHFALFVFPFFSLLLPHGGIP